MAHKATKRMILAIAGLLLAFSMRAGDVKEYKYFIRNDVRVHYCTCDGVTVIVDPSDGGICNPAITIINESGHEFLFEPRKIKAFSYAIPKQKDKWERHHVKMWFDCGYEPSLLERDSVTVFTYEQYRRRTSRNIWWGGFISTVGTSAVDAALIKDDYGKYLSAIRQENQMERNSAQRSQALRQIDENYWRSNTIFNGEEHRGYIALKDVLSDQMLLQIPVNGEVFEFFVQSWN